MPTIETSTVIARPVTEVWDFISDPTNHSVWDAAQLGTVQLTDGPVGVGTRWQGATRVLGKRFEWTFEFTEYEPYRRRVTTSVAGTRPSFTTCITAEPDGDKTLLTFRATAESGLGGVFGRLADPIVERAYTRTLTASLDNLADVLTTEAPCA
jgi:uncharacterized protein YndB with AHSA1/START domain